MKKIAFISTEIWSSYNPEGIVARKILNGLIDCGYDVEVITTKKFEYKNITVISNGIPEFLDKIIKYFFGIEKLFFIKRVIQYLNISSHKYDIIITRSEPVVLHLIHSFLKTKAKKIAMFSDIGYLNPYYSKFLLLKKVILFLIEKNIIGKVDILTHTNRFVVEKYINNGFESRKFRIFPNPLELSEISNNVAQRGKKCKETISLAYTGSLYGSRNPDKFFSYLASQENKKFTVYLIGAVRNMYYEKQRFGKIGVVLKNKELNLLKNKIEYFGLNDNIIILPFMRKSELEEFIKNNIDILVNIDAPSKVNLFLSSKVVDYIQYNLPILNISTEGASVDFLKNVGIRKYMDHNKEFNYSLRDIVETGYFLPDYKLIHKYSTVNLLNKLISEKF